MDDNGDPDWTLILSFLVFDLFVAAMALVAYFTAG